jgi:hypothetical protein
MPPTDVIMAMLHELLNLLASGKLHLDIERIPLSGVAEMWTTNGDAARSSSHKECSVRGWADGDWAWCGRSGSGRALAGEDEGRGLAAELAVERGGGVGAGRCRSSLTRAAGK